MKLFFASDRRWSLRNQLVRRIVLSLVIAFAAGLAATLMMYRISDTRSRELQHSELASHFQTRIAKLDNDLLVQADVFRVQLEFNRLLETVDPSYQKVTAYLNSVGGQQVFTHVFIFDANKRSIFAFTTRSERMSEAPKLSGKEGMSWAYNAQTQTMYRSVEQKIWMGSYGSGWLVLYVPADNTLLQSITYPGTTLRLQREGKVFTATDAGQELHPTDQAVEVVLPWGADLDRPELAVIKTYVAPLPLIETLLVIGLTTLFTLVLSIALMAQWLERLVKRLQHLGGAAALFGKDRNVPAPIQAQLNLASATQTDEVSGLVQSIEAMMDDVHKANAQLLSSEQKFASIFRHSPVALALTRVQGDVCVDVNDAWTTLFARKREDVVGRGMADLMLYPDENYRAHLQTHIGKAASASGLEARLLTGQGIRHAKLSLEKVWIAETEYLIERFEDITERLQSEQRINKLAFFDPLTDLPNRTLLIDRMGQALVSQDRIAKYGAVLMIDLDNFKTLNDTRGHALGDLLLQEVAQRMRLCLREGDTVARLGGDEFVVLLLGLSEEEADAASDVEVAAEKVLAAVAQPYMLGELRHYCTASIGISVFKGHQTSVDDLLKQADMAMYKSKDAGRNAIRFFDPSLEQAVKERADMERDLRLAIANREFQLYYQPQVTDVNTVTGAECLLRWTHSSGRMVSPAEFIALAEETGLIVPLGQWVLETACMQLAAWAEDGAMAHLVLAVNVSAVQFHQADFVETVLATIKRTRANPQRLKIELTESLLVSNITETIEAMHRLKDRGVGFSLDDFGTGFSSLSYLKRLPLDQLKIDQSFVGDLLTDPNNAAIAKTIITLGESLGLEVIAEGVETQAQREFLAQFGCYAYQGYLFSRPVPLAAFETYAHASPNKDHQ